MGTTPAVRIMEDRIMLIIRRFLGQEYFHGVAEHYGEHEHLEKHHHIPRHLHVLQQGSFLHIKMNITESNCEGNLDDRLQDCHEEVTVPM